MSIQFLVGLLSSSVRNVQNFSDMTVSYLQVTLMTQSKIVSLRVADLWVLLLFTCPTVSCISNLKCYESHQTPSISQLAIHSGTLYSSVDGPSVFS